MNDELEAARGLMIAVVLGACVWLAAFMVAL